MYNCMKTYISRSFKFQDFSMTDTVFQDFFMTEFEFHDFQWLSRIRGDPVKLTKLWSAILKLIQLWSAILKIYLTLRLTIFKFTRLSDRPFWSLSDSLISHFEIYLTFWLAILKFTWLSGRPVSVPPAQWVPFETVLPQATVVADDTILLPLVDVDVFLIWAQATTF